MSIYERTSAPPPVPPPTPAPGPVSSSYMYEGCFDDSKSNRIMAKEATDTSMTAEVRLKLVASVSTIRGRTPLGKQSK